MVVDKITDEELRVLHQLLYKQEILANKAENALLESQLSEKEKQIFLLNLYIKYQLDSSYRIQNNGEIKKIEKEESEKNE